jgi:hypothetical protein
MEETRRAGAGVLQEQGRGGVSGNACAGDGEVESVIGRRMVSSADRFFGRMRGMKGTGIDRTAFWSGTLEEAERRDEAEWLAMTPEQRMEALEEIRAINYGYFKEAAARPKLERVYRVVDLREQ